jgi:hypothetical protein
VSVGATLGFAAMLGTVVLPSLTGCSSGHGGCVTHNPSYPSSDDACYDGKSESECNAMATYGDTARFHEGATGSSLGSTLTCPGEDSHHPPAFAPCP